MILTFLEYSSKIAFLPATSGTWTSTTLSKLKKNGKNWERMEEIEKELKKLRKNGTNWEGMEEIDKVLKERRKSIIEGFRGIDRRRSKYALHAYRDRLLKIQRHRKIGRWQISTCKQTQN